MDIINNGITNTRGASDELSDTQSGTSTIWLDNSDGRFTPGLASSPYYPGVKRNCPIRVGVLTTAKNLMSGSSANFEVDTGEWVPFSNDPNSNNTIQRDTSKAFEGSASLLGVWGSTTAGLEYIECVVRGLDIGVTYTASLYVWVTAGVPAVQLSVTGLATGTSSTTTGAWQRLTCTFTATSTSAYLHLTTTGASSYPANVWIDAVQVEQGSSATAYDTPAVMNWRFIGMVNEWPVSWEGLASTVAVTATDAFKWLARKNETQPMLVEEILLDAPFSYYPMSEASGSTTAGDLSGRGAATTLAVQQAGSGGTLAFGAGTGPAATGQSAPVFTPSSSSAGKYLYADLGYLYNVATGATYLFAEAWFSTTTTDRVILSVKNPLGDCQMTFALDSATGKLAITSYNALSSTTTVLAGTTSLADGALHHMVYDDLNEVVYIDGTSYSVTTAFQYGIQQLSVGSVFGTRLWSGTICHVALYASPLASFGANLAQHYAAGATGNSGESASARMTRLAAYAGLTVTTQGSFSNVASQGALGQSALTHMREVETTEGGKLAAARDTPGLLFQSRSIRYNPVAAFSVAYADLDTDNVQLADDDQKLCNTVIASRPAGATQRVIDSTSRAANGPAEKQLDLLKTTDNEALDAANWVISRYADPAPELREIPLEAYSLGNTAYAQILAADIGTPFTVTGLPAQAPASSATVTVEGYTETIKYRQHQISFHVSASNTDTVWVLNSSTYSVLGSTTRLAY